MQLWPRCGSGEGGQALTLATLRASWAAFVGWLQACWQLRPWAQPGPENTRTDTSSIDEGRVRANTVLGRLERLVAAEDLELVVDELEAHRRSGLAGEVVAKFLCATGGRCVETRIQPAEKSSAAAARRLTPRHQVRPPLTSASR